MDNKEALKAANEFLDAGVELGTEWVEKANALLPFCEDGTENLYRTAARIFKQELIKSNDLNLSLLKDMESDLMSKAQDIYG